MERKISTAISDLVLAASAFTTFFIIHGREKDLNSDTSLKFVKWWLMQLAMAASLGVVRFGCLLRSHHSTVTKYHRNFSWLTLSVGLPCLAAEVCSMYDIEWIMKFYFGMVILNFYAASRLRDSKDKITSLVAVISVLTMLILAVINNNTHLTLLCVCLALSGIIGDDGHIFTYIPRVDLFHYILVICNICTPYAFVDYT